MKESEEERYSDKVIRIIVTVVAVLLGGFLLYTAATFPCSQYIQRGIFAGASLFLVFSIYRSGKGKWHLVLDVILALAGAGLCAYVVLNSEEIFQRAPQPIGMEPWLGLALIFIILEAGRRTCGLALPIMASLFMLYAVVGSNLPGDLGFANLSIQQVLAYQYTSLSGIWGSVTGVTATMVAAFVIFGAFLSESGIERTFSMLALSLAGRLKSGPPMVAVISSAFIGMISGSSVANVLTTGSYTIPLMKRYGFSPPFSAAVEASASTGGLIMPPIMGAAAFVMAEFLDVSYFKIMVAAIIPALIYFLMVGLQVNAEVNKRRLGKILEEKEVPKLKYILLKRGYQLLPLLVLVALISYGWPAAKACFYGTLSVVLISLILKETRMGPRKILNSLVNSMKMLLGVTGACLCAVIIVGTLAQTGLGTKLGLILISLAGEHEILALILTMLCTIILGMGLPVVAAYVIAASAMTVGLNLLGLPSLVSHFFILYYASFGTITPPVCMTAYAAASLAKANWFHVAIYACKLGIAAFILPYTFIYNKAILLMGSPLEILQVFIMAIIASLMLAGGLSGWLKREIAITGRILLVSGGLLLLTSSTWYINIAGLVLGGIEIFRESLFLANAKAT
jgi:TRAP transporter 4TM/12TM fusion protein